MPNLPKTMEEWGAGLSARWQAALGAVSSSLLVYVVGYLVLRFHLTALGLGTDIGLHLKDERYFFAGAKFLIYLVAAIPNLLILALPLAALAWLLYRLLPGAARAAMARWAAALPAGAISWTGVTLAVLVIQFLMRQVFTFSNLLVAPGLTGAPAWLVQTACRPGRLSLYFSALVAACAVSGALFYLARNRAAAGSSARTGIVLLGLLFAIELAFLPLTYGCLIFDKEIARVGTLDGDTPLQPGQHAWLVWETERSTTYLVQEPDGSRALVTLKSEAIKRKMITGYDFVLERFFRDACRT